MKINEAKCDKCDLLTKHGYPRSDGTRRALCPEHATEYLEEMLYQVGSTLEKMESRIFEVVDEVIKEAADGLEGIIKNDNEWKAEANAWEETAEQNAQNADYYRGLIERCGKAIGARAFIARDGSKSLDVLCAKVPEIIEKDYGDRGWDYIGKTRD